mgnify:CR=1 FL=1
MRILCSLLFYTICSNCYGQFYIDSIATDELDKSYKLANSYLKKAEYDKAILSYDSLIIQWDQLLNEEANESYYQNYYFIRIKKFQAKNRINKLLDDDIKIYFRLEGALIDNLSRNNLVIGGYYSSIAKYQRTKLSDLEQSIAYSNKAINIFKSYGDRYLSLIGRECIEMGYAYRNVADYENAEKFFNRSIDVKQQISPVPVKDILYSQYAIAALYHNQQKYDKALELTLRIADDAEKHFATGHRFIVNSLDLISILYEEKGDKKKSLEYSFKCLNAKRVKSDIRNGGLEKQYHRISSMYSGLGEYKLAVTYIDSALLYVKETKKNYRISAVYNSKALLEQNIDQKLIYQKKSVEYCKQDQWCKKVNLATFLSNTAIAYEHKGDSKSALNYILKAKDIKESKIELMGSSLPNTYAILANSYDKLGEQNLADEYYQKAITITLKYRGKDNHFLASQYNFYGNYLLKNGRIDISKKYLDKAYRILEKEKNQNAEVSINNKLYLSRLHETKGNYKESLKYALESYNEKGNQYSESNTISINQLINAYYNIGNIDTCKILADELLANSGFYDIRKSHSKSNISPLRNSWLSYNTFLYYIKVNPTISDSKNIDLTDKVLYGLDLIKKVRTEIFYEASEKELQNNVREFFNWAIQELGREYYKCNDTVHLSLLYECMESSKSILMDRQQIREAAISKSKVPIRIIEREKDLLFTYEKSYNNFIAQSQEDNTTSKNDFNNLFEIQKEKEAFVDTLKKFYSDYYQKRYIQNIPSLEACQQLAATEDRTFLIYHWGDTLIHQLIITGSISEYEVIQVSDIELPLSQLERIIKTPNTAVSEDKFELEKRLFIDLGRYLYELLMSNIDTTSSTLTIIPDGKLVNLPFEVLLFDSVDKSESYRYLPYLCRKYSVNYSGSMSQYYTLSKHDGYKSTKEYVGFAPAYKYDMDNGNYLTNNRVRQNTTQLLYNMSEVSVASTIFEGVHHVGESATESQFYITARESHIIHLAMHTKVMSDDSTETYLQFEPQNAEEDGKLYLDEIARLNLNSNLVVLSACETNVGENIIGESILGIARAFQIAACPNIVMTNWLIDDKSSSTIIPTFLEGIKNRVEPAIALQNAKLEYLQNCSEVQSHPYFWSGYSYYGSAQIKDPTSKTLLFLSLLIIAIFIIPISIRILKKTSD